MLTTTLLLLAFSTPTFAHTHFETINGKSDCMRQWKPKSERFNPVMDPSSKDMMCNSLGETEAQATCDIDAGSSIELQYTHGKQPKPISESHKGPCSVYLSRPGSNQWAKVYEHGYDESRGGWCTMKMRDDNGKYAFTLPKEVPSGKWIMRVEMAALHNSKTKYDPSTASSGTQFYIQCADINVKGSSNGTLTPTVAIPSAEYATIDTEALNYNIWKNKNNYGSFKMFGPPLAVPASVSSSNSTNSSTSNSTNKAPGKGESKPAGKAASKKKSKGSGKKKSSKKQVKKEAKKQRKLQRKLDRKNKKNLKHNKSPNAKAPKTTLAYSPK